MSKLKRLKGEARWKMIHELEDRFNTQVKKRQYFTYLRKKYLWLFVVESTKFIKRFIDIFLSLFLLIVLSPLFLLIAILIKLYDKGPVLYITNRVGKWGKEFRFPKFRTMKVDADKELAKLLANNQKQIKRFKLKDDPRITKIGYFLRKTSLDELPQLWCVLKGEMSLVGPRPPLPHEVANYTLEERKRLDITPGITGIWQVSGRSEIPFKKQVHLDKEYIKSQSLFLDLKLLLKTIPAVLLGKGAY